MKSVDHADRTSNLSFVHEGLPGRIVFGAGSRLKLAGELDLMGVDRVLMIVAPDLVVLGDELAAQLGGRVVGRFTEVREHVPIATAVRARALAAELGADALLSIGGGSSTGTAKAIALTSGLPLVAVPTTYAGSEVTPVWGITENARKTTGTDPRVLPRVVVYDPELTVGLPLALSSASALNAVAHCVDALWAPRRSPISDLIAGEGIRALAAGLRALPASGSLARARTDLLYGAYLAGSAFATAGTGLHHKICHVLGGALDLRHAMTHAIVLPHVLAFNAPHARDAADRVAQALGTTDAVAGLRSLAFDAGVPRGLHELGMSEDQIDVIAKLVVENAPASNPSPPTPTAVRALIEAAWAG
ncbi:maleylacetate reductase [Micromonospora rhizosphaerae]|uniref:Maleylacetate reductase n=1 Tax=Micromonospora rhizosphaerae TaxID=568872 RepID=A0A1C6SD95_9ACTN|nr:maleylacetate reductase [Micromonospora rhizosphaerae]SCL27340.1 maleylacetate reductase [Micromonospora rhizosphaerae]